jgi:hypothetical protein
MKRVVGVLFLLSAVAAAQIGIPFPGPGGVEAGCATPSGTTMTEPFGEGTNLFADGGASGAAQLWNITAGSAALTASPAGAPANTVCATSLHITQANTTKLSVWTTTQFQSIPAATTVDVDMYFYLASTTLAAWGNQRFFSLAADSAGATSPGQVLWHQSSAGSYNLYASGSTTSNTSSANTAFVLNTWTRLRLHYDATAANCSIRVNSAAAETFTCNAQPIYYAAFGDNSSTKGFDFYIGYLSISAPGYGPLTAPPNVWVNFEGGSNGNDATTAIAASGTVGGNGSWAINAPTAGCLIVDNGSQQNLPAAMTVAGSNWSDNGTRGWKWVDSNTCRVAAMYLRWTPTIIPHWTPGTGASVVNASAPTSASVGFMVTKHQNNLYPRTLANVRDDNNGGDSTSVGIHGEQNAICLATDGSQCVTANDDNPYWVTVLKTPCGINRLRLYDPATWAQIGPELTLDHTGHACHNFSGIGFGQPGADSTGCGAGGAGDCAGQYWKVDNAIVDLGLNGQAPAWPLLPPR